MAYAREGAKLALCQRTHSELEETVKGNPSSRGRMQGLELRRLVGRTRERFYGKCPEGIRQG
jgi:hypothetical protein